MTLTIQVAPEIETALEEEAARNGLTPEQYAGDVLADWLLEMAQDIEDAEEARSILAKSDPLKRRTLAELRHALGR